MSTSTDERCVEVEIKEEFLTETQIFCTCISVWFTFRPTTNVPWEEVLMLLLIDELMDAVQEPNVWLSDFFPLFLHITTVTVAFKLFTWPESLGTSLNHVCGIGISQQNYDPRTGSASLERRVDTEASLLGRILVYWTFFFLKIIDFIYFLMKKNSFRKYRK